MTSLEATLAHYKSEQSVDRDNGWLPEHVSLSHEEERGRLTAVFTTGRVEVVNDMVEAQIQELICAREPDRS